MRTIGIEYKDIGEACFYDLGDPPALKSSEILIATEYSGITNGTERHALLAEHGWQGGGRHGYQHVGRIVRVGDAVTQFRVGQRVFVGHYVGHRGWQVVDLGIHNAVAFLNPLVIELPEDVNPKACALMGVAGVALRGMRRFRVQPAQRVWVLGQGLIGHFAAQAARAMGAEVTVSDIDPKRLELARKCVAQVVLNAQAPEFLDVFTQDGPYDRIVDCSGIPDLMQMILDHRLLAYGGVIGLLAVRTNTTFLWGMLHQTEASIEVSCHFGCDDLRVLLHFMRQGVIQVDPVITHEVSIDNALEIYKTLRDDPGSLMGVVFDWTAVS